MNTDYKNINTRILERYLLGELPGAKMKEIRQRLKEDPVLQETLRQLKQSDQEILSQYPPGIIVPQVLNVYSAEKAKLEPAPVTRPGLFMGKRWLYAAPAFALVLVVFIFWFPMLNQQTRIKGGPALDMTKPHLMIYRKNNDQVELLKNGSRANAGDLLQIAYVPANETYGIILSIDGSGTVTLHFPEKADRSPLLKQEKKVLLDTAYELDDAPGYERFFFITSSSAIDVGGVMKQAKLLAQSTGRAKTENLRLPGGIKQISVLITKGSK